VNIGQAARSSGVPAKTIRYYEEIGLIGPAQRADNGYRAFSDTDIETLRFISRARSLGFSVKDVGRLLSLYADKHRASADVKAIAQDTIERIDEKIAELQAMRSTLSVLVERCHGDDRPDCPILEGIATPAQLSRN
jgi:Cu(I)-responsive transcriptional regulator